MCRSPERAFLIRNGWLGFRWRAAVFCRWTWLDGRSARCLLAPVQQCGLDAACRRSWRLDCLSFGRQVAKSLVVATISCGALSSSCHLSAAGVRHPLDLRSASLIRFSGMSDEPDPSEAAQERDEYTRAIALSRKRAWARRRARERAHQLALPILVAWKRLSRWYFWIMLIGTVAWVCFYSLPALLNSR